MPKSDSSGQKSHIGTGTKKWYRYPRCSGQVVPVPLKLVPIPIDSKGLVPVPVKVVPVPQLPAALILHIFAPLSFVFVYRLVRDPKKRLMGVQIRMRLSEKRTIRFASAIFV